MEFIPWLNRDEQILCGLINCNHIGVTPNYYKDLYCPQITQISTDFLFRKSDIANPKTLYYSF
ncbi:hypothetical protein PEPS_33630 (plasmid) [Persicobacter psychrovividus]|uniref:Uncharacterized protein n=1 Tax=Persicobacter psychrovividus TaxID=387638 RepID=A0ABM7VJC7_9BACT|nr:hypothetical protein PEPS_33630 [Persicobacter psychrovividus]